jgi:putative spermidine/putrescine transport system substrate-binding protein
MNEHDDMRADLTEILNEKAARGGIDRRDFLIALSLLGIAPTTSALAQGRSIVMANWGGTSADAFMAAWGTPYGEGHGLKVVSDGSGPSIGRIKAMVEAKAVTWDVCDSNAGESEYLGENGLVEQVDYTVIDPKKVFPDAKFRWGVSSYFFSYVLAYDSERVKKPTGWEDFWNLKEFPGKRALRKNVTGMCECAMLADGVPREEIYKVLSAPGGIERAMKKFRDIKDSVIFWDSGAQSAQLLRDHEVIMANIWTSRASVLHNETNGKLTWIWNGGLLVPSVWTVPRGNPAGSKAAFEFANYCLTPEQQIILLKLTGSGPSNPAASSLVPENLRFFDPTQPENRAVQASLNTEWYAKFQDRARDQYLEMQSS